MSKEQEMKNMVQQLVSDLGKSGIKVESAAILNLGDTTPTQDKTVDAAVKNVLNKMAKSGFPGSIPGFIPTPNFKNPMEKPAPLAKQEQLAEEPKLEEKCYCPSCFNFNTFEEILKDEGGKFDYKTVVLGGKNFDIKYHIDKNGRENIMISPQEFKVDPSWTVDQLQEGLNVAVQQKDFDKAQIFLNAINNLKTKQA